MPNLCISFSQVNNDPLFMHSESCMNTICAYTSHRKLAQKVIYYKPSQLTKRFLNWPSQQY